MCCCVYVEWQQKEPRVPHPTTFHVAPHHRRKRVKARETLTSEENERELCNVTSTGSHTAPVVARKLAADFSKGEVMNELSTAQLHVMQMGQGGQVKELDFNLQLFGQQKATFNQRETMLVMASIAASVQVDRWCV